MNKGRRTALDNADMGEDPGLTQAEFAALSGKQIAEIWRIRFPNTFTTRELMGQTFERYIMRLLAGTIVKASERKRDEIWRVLDGSYPGDDAREARIKLYARRAEIYMNRCGAIVCEGEDCLSVTCAEHHAEATVFKPVLRKKRRWRNSVNSAS